MRQKQSSSIRHHILHERVEREKKPHDAVMVNHHPHGDSFFFQVWVETFSVPAWQTATATQGDACPISGLQKSG